MGTRTTNYLLAVLLSTGVLAPSTADASQRARDRGADAPASAPRDGDIGQRVDRRPGGTGDRTEGLPTPTPPRPSRRPDQAGDPPRYDRQHALVPSRSRQAVPPPSQRSAPPYAEAAFAAGYQSGYGKGGDDGRTGERYDPARHREYRDADGGYTESYGSKDAYRTNYRAGFRKGYEEGYRTGARNRR